MNLIVDANILFSALLRNSITAELLLRSDLHLFSPEFLFTEFEKYEEELVNRTERTIDNFQSLMIFLRRRINIIPHEDIAQFMDDARKISPDEKDTVYIALALKLQCPIWSNDKVLKDRQNIIKIFHTGDLLNVLGVL